MCLLVCQVHAARAKGRPYTIVFVGVNGVGKSTNLAKICYWLLQNDVKVHWSADASHGEPLQFDITMASSASKMLWRLICLRFVGSGRVMLQ